MADNTESMPEDVQETDTPEVDQLEQQPDETKNAEAAKYRRRLRETETDRDQLAAKLEDMQKDAIERLLSGTLAKPAGLWAAGHDVASMLDDDGNIDADKVQQAADHAIVTLGLEKYRSNMMHVPKEGNVTNPRGTRSWEDAFKA
ncbi:MAG TPA: hypothetical protein H9836_16515 [Candidatus Nocardiopsis merdipullorum]|nr:hypothetical protein [Candidatus Nocardiopsis merdipullorum]